MLATGIRGGSCDTGLSARGSCQSWTESENTVVCPGECVRTVSHMGNVAGIRSAKGLCGCRGQREEAAVPVCIHPSTKNIICVLFVKEGEKTKIEFYDFVQL